METIKQLNYKEVMNRLDEVRGRGSIPGLDTIKDLLQRIGNPQEQLQFIHIAGTNGKGSIAAYMSSILKESGYRVGRYVSPTLLTYWERISFRGRDISRKDVTEGLNLIFRHFDQMKEEGKNTPTIFEIETALAFWYFKKKACDIVVLETGMGGRLDATNCIPAPVVAVIASVSMDHMDFLGDSLAQIAYEKAGIIKRGCHVVSAKQFTEVTEVLKQRCEQEKVPFIEADPFYVTHEKASLKGQSFRYHKETDIKIKLLGTYQKQNAIVAYEAIKVMIDCGYTISKKEILSGFQKTEWFGRFTVLSVKPLIVADGAHNEDAAKKLAETIRFYFTNKKIVFIMGVLRDKEYTKIIDELSAFPQAVITVTPPIRERALPAIDLAKEWRRVMENVTAADSVPEALELAQLLSGEDGVILAFGSLSYLNEVRYTGEGNLRRQK